MQPHVNLGINFRRHFEPFGFSLKRSKRPIEKRIHTIQRDFKAGLIREVDANRILTELRSILREIDKRGK